MPERGAQDVQGLRDLRGGGGVQGLFHVAHDLLGTGRPVRSLRVGVSLGLALHRQNQDVCQELPSCRGHKQAGISLQGKDGAQGAWRGGETELGSAETWLQSADTRTPGQGLAFRPAGRTVRGPWPSTQKLEFPG